MIPAETISRVQRPYGYPLKNVRAELSETPSFGGLQGLLARLHEFHSDLVGMAKLVCKGSENGYYIDLSEEKDNWRVKVKGEIIPGSRSRISGRIVGFSHDSIVVENADQNKVAYYVVAESKTNNENNNKGDISWWRDLPKQRQSKTEKKSCTVIRI